MTRAASKCDGSNMPARWIPHPLSGEIEIPICPICGHNGFKARTGGYVPVHKALHERTEKELRRLEFDQTNVRGENGTKARS